MSKDLYYIDTETGEIEPFVGTVITEEQRKIIHAKKVRQLQYKSKYKGKQFYQINTYYPSSQICSRCDNQDRRYKDLTRREYKCTKCNQELDRDLNASINIMFEGLKLYMKNYVRI